MAVSESDVNELFGLAADFVLHTDRSVFLTGKAGTGKTTFLKYIREHGTKRMAVVAPTGVAAINAGGMTLHSFFQLPFGPFIPEKAGGFFSMGSSGGMDLDTLLGKIRISREKRKLMEELELLIIDEVSMLRADMLDAMDGLLRFYRRNHAPFGGLQILYIGDLYQLPPVVKEEEWQLLGRYYKSLFFFDARVMQQSAPVIIELERVYRQKDNTFITVLNKLRKAIADEDDIRNLNKYYDPYFHPEPEDGYIILTSHNSKAARINKGELDRLQAEVHQFDAEEKGIFQEHAAPADKELVLKEGAQVMFIRNDKGNSRRYYNGKIAHVSRIRNGQIYVKFPGEYEEILLEKETWRNIRFHYDAGQEKVVEEELGTFTQYPVRLAWAVTIHKSQGLTFEKAIVDAGASFAAGQVYVALSRLTSMSGLVLASEIRPESLLVDERVIAWDSGRPDNEVLREWLELDQMHYLGKWLAGCFDWTAPAGQLGELIHSVSRSRMKEKADVVTHLEQAKPGVEELRHTGLRFTQQLESILPVAVSDGYRYLEERINAAEVYYRPRISRQIRMWEVHAAGMQDKKGLSRYMEGIKNFRALLLKKELQLDQARTVCAGLIRGKKPGELLRNLEPDGQVYSGERKDGNQN